MKKILLASILSFAAFSTFAETGTDPAFAKVEQLMKSKNYNAAYQELDKLAKTGNAQALYNLAYLTQMGQGTAKDDKKALSLYQQSAAKGYSVASYVLAQSYANGELGLAKDAKKSQEFLEKSSAQGFDDATVELAVLYFSNNEDQKGLQKLDPLLKKGNLQALHAKALYDLSLGYKTKNEATFKQGISTIESLAQKGYTPALMTLANMLTNGNILKQNLPEAKKIYTALAAEKIPKAKESLDVVNKLIAEQAKAPAPK